MSELHLILAFIAFASCLVSFVWLMTKAIGGANNLMEPLTFRLWEQMDWIVLPVRVLLIGVSFLIEIPGLILSATIIVLFYIMIGIQLILKWLVACDKKEVTGELFNHIVTNPFCGSY